VKGTILHEKVDNPFIHESRREYLISRSVPLVTYSLGFYGISDAVEFKKATTGFYIKSKNNHFKAYPVEYKLGKPKKDSRDAVQLCVQGICLEEMLDIRVDEAYLYYGKTKHREKIVLDQSLREEVKSLSREMHDIMKKDLVILEEYSSKCDNCSLYNICLPKNQTNYKSVQNYIRIKLKENDGEG
jgi:CRISPR-associated exonuclease Cas4